MDGTPSEYELNEFWRLMSPWLLSRGYMLYDLGVPERSRLYNARCADTWYPPLTGTAAPLPYAILHNTKASIPREFDISVSCAKHYCSLLPNDWNRLGWLALRMFPAEMSC